MFKFSIIFLIALNVIDEATAEKQNSQWLLQLGIREIPLKQLNDNDTSTKGNDAAMQNSIQVATEATSGKQYPHWLLQLGIREIPLKLDDTGKQSECAKGQITGKSALPLEKLGGNFYYFGTFFKVNFFKAMEFCKNHGMDLVSIETMEENIRIVDYIGKNLNHVDHFWTSGSDLGEEGRFVWLATGKSFNFTYWSPPQPDNAGKNENCVQVRKIGYKHYIWNDVGCDTKHDIICEIRECNSFCIN